MPSTVALPICLNNSSSVPPIENSVSSAPSSSPRSTSAEPGIPPPRYFSNLLAEFWQGQRLNDPLIVIPVVKQILIGDALARASGFPEAGYRRIVVIDSELPAFRESLSFHGLIQPAVGADDVACVFRLRSLARIPSIMSRASDGLSTPSTAHMCASAIVSASTCAVRV
ncbi:hypothetical protein L1887_46631 [Cichorium endivia]|nr:hypothetical protein L1887_46631 [Cichorium endivia]